MHPTSAPRSPASRDRSGLLKRYFALILCSPRYDLTELAAAIRQRCGELPLFVCSWTTAGEIKLFGFISGGLGGNWFPAVGFVIAGTFLDHHLCKRLFPVEEVQQVSHCGNWISQRTR